MPFFSLLKIEDAFQIFQHFPLNMNTLQTIRMSGVGESGKTTSGT
jgi:hypothetical protein